MKSKRVYSNVTSKKNCIAWEMDLIEYEVILQRAPSPECLGWGVSSIHNTPGRRLTHCEGGSVRWGRPACFHPQLQWWPSGANTEALAAAVQPLTVLRGAMWCSPLALPVRESALAGSHPRAKPTDAKRFSNASVLMRSALLQSDMCSKIAPPHIHYLPTPHPHPGPGHPAPLIMRTN